jgi:hypothetical protein
MLKKQKKGKKKKKKGKGAIHTVSSMKVLDLNQIILNSSY